MARLPRLMHRTYSPRVMKLDGGFAGLFRLNEKVGLFSRTYRDPVLVSGTDGVGTKLKVAQLMGRHDSVGIDLVAMCVNDIICCGAEPLFFLDYVAMSHDDPELLEQIVSGISDGCLQSEAALLGGETAIMPDLYQRGDYDLAGFAVGVVEKKNVIDGKQIGEGDVIIGLKSSGFHSNGYSLIRKAVFEIGKCACQDHVASLGRTIGETLLQPTRIYAVGIRKVLRHYRVKNVVHGIAHITGGGLAENIERILPADVDIQIDQSTWSWPTEFQWLQKLGQIKTDEMQRVFNLGIGMVLVVSRYYSEQIRRILTDSGYENLLIGQAVRGNGKVTIG